MSNGSKADIKRRTNVEKQPTSGGRWTLGTGTSSRSYELESWNYIRQKDYQLHLLQKAHKLSKLKPPIQTSEWERLAFIRCYTTAPFKTQISFLQQDAYGTFFWLYIANVLLRNLPINYIHIFLSAYNPNEHLFGSKMIPLCQGVSWQVVLCGVLQLVASADILALFIHYSLTGFYLYDPWNKCPRTWINITPIPKPFRCYTVQEFYNITKKYEFFGRDPNKSITFEFNTYLFPNKTYFTNSPLYFFIASWVKLNVRQYFSMEFVIIFFFIWLLAAAFYKQLFNKYIWKFVTVSEITISVIYICAFLYICYYFLEVPVGSEYSRSRYAGTKTMEAVKAWDLQFYAESISGPPIVHLLSSRSTNEVDPARDSIVMTLSNSLKYIFKGLAQYRLKYYIQSVYNSTTVGVSKLHPYPIFYMWPFFFGTVLGPFLARLFYTLNFILEFTIFMITYQLLIEVIVSEWKWARRWVTTLVIAIAGLTMNLTLEYNTKTYLYIFTTAITSLTEAIVVCWLYPGLTDDIHFHKGTAVPAWRKWSLRILPWYYVYKIYLSFQGLIVNIEQISTHGRSVNNELSATRWAWLVGILPLPLGALFAIFDHIMNGKDWKKLLNPRADWGPQDIVTRQLRKQFDSKEYVCSQSPRYLCRHIITKSQTPSYRLNVRPHDTDRRSTIFTDTYRHQGDRKHI